MYSLVKIVSLMYLYINIFLESVQDFLPTNFHQKMERNCNHPPLVDEKPTLGPNTHIS